MTFATVGVVVDHTIEDGALVVTSSKRISAEIRCEGELLGRLVHIFQEDGLPDRRYMFAKDFSLPQLLPLQKISFVSLQDMVDFLKQKFETFELGSRHIFVVCYHDDVRIICATVQIEGLLLEDLDPDTEAEAPSTLYSSSPIAV